MKRPLLAALLVAHPFAAAAQDAPEVYQPTSSWGLEAKVDGYFRQEWTDEITFVDDSRQLGRIRPRVELSVGSFLVAGVGGDFMYGSQENTVPPPNLATLPLLRDNYDARDARLDLAFLRITAGPIRLEGGRFAMPIRFTEMIWDRELRPQGGAVTLEVRNVGPFARLSATGLGARGSHVFPQEDGPFDFSDRETVWIASGSAVLGRDATTSLELVGSYLTWQDLEHVDPRLRRQNSRTVPAGPLGPEYDVVDLVARYVRTGGAELQLIANYCWNTAVEERNKGLWLAAVLGSTRTARSAIEYTYAKVDPDATLAAFAADDFLWETGWEGHRVDLGFRLAENFSIHGIGQKQRFKDAPQEAERNRWLDRYRVELRFRN
jgi:hypothetical protein